MAIYLGLISGTSMDAVDAALVDFRDDSGLILLAYRETPYPAMLATALHAARAKADALPLAALYTLDAKVAHTFADAAIELLRHANVASSDVVAIGSHGQTVCHYPNAEPPFTVQVGDPNVIAAMTGITTVADIRRMDIAVGGQGAPLAPGFHAQLFSHPTRHRVIVNIGGIANLTVLPAGGADVLGFDSGPGNALMDDWASTHLAAARDDGGGWARTGVADAALLADLLADPYFARSPPKSTGREYFSLAWLRTRLEGYSLSSADVQATLLQLTVRTVTSAVRAFAPRTEEVFVCGGGVNNAALMDALRVALEPLPLASTAALGIPPAAVEAVMMAWLAKRRLESKSGNVPAVTGARTAAILGGVYLPPP